MSKGPARFGGRGDAELVVVLDCSDLERSATFWCVVLGYRAEPGSPGRYQQLMPTDGNGVELLLQQVAEPKVAKNRLHLDLRVPDLKAETARVVALGARCITNEPFEEYGWSWHVLADPDGNEFCVLQPPRNHGDDRLPQAKGEYQPLAAASAPVAAAPPKPGVIQSVDR